MRPWTSSARRLRGRRGGPRAARAASSVRERDALDTLVEHDLAVERAVHRALGGDDAQALDLLVGEARRAGAGRARSGWGSRARPACTRTSTSTPPMSQPLRFAYISIVIAVHEARLAASSSCGLGPLSSPPASVGSSMLEVVTAHPHDVPVAAVRVAVAFIRRSILADLSL